MKYILIIRTFDPPPSTYFLEESAPVMAIAPCTHVHSIEFEDRDSAVAAQVAVHELLELPHYGAAPKIKTIIVPKGEPSAAVSE